MANILRLCLSKRQTSRPPLVLISPRRAEDTQGPLPAATWHGLHHCDKQVCSGEMGEIEKQKVRVLRREVELMTAGDEEQPPEAMVMSCLCCYQGLGLGPWPCSCRGLCGCLWPMLPQVDVFVYPAVFPNTCTESCPCPLLFLVVWVRDSCPRRYEQGRAGPVSCLQRAGHLSSTPASAPSRSSF